MNTKWLIKEGAVARTDGFYDKRGRKLQGGKLTQAQVDEWNGVVTEEYVPEAPAMLNEVEDIDSALIHLNESESFISKISKKLSGN